MKTQAKKPNVIIVMTDQQRADLRKSNGYPLDVMPFLDAWAKSGVDFNRAYSPNPTCMPARVSMFTGRYASAHRVRTNYNGPDAVYSEDLLDVLKKAGYRAALCGKNHTHRNPEKDFDFYASCGALGDTKPPSQDKNERLHDEYIETLDSMETYTPSPGGLKGQKTYRIVSSALEFIDGCQKDEPFFLWVSILDPHNPYQACEPYFEMFSPESLPPLATSVADLTGKGHRFPWMRGIWEKVLGEDIDDRIQRARSNYHGMLRMIDDQFKRLVEGLRDRGIEDDTLIIFLSDHGDFIGEYGLLRKGPDLPDILTRIPMIWAGPGVTPQPRNDEDCINTVDILPTICDMLGIPIPFGAQGKSIAPLLTGGPKPLGEYDIAYAESGYGGQYWTDEDELNVITEGASIQWRTFDELNTWTQCGQVRMVRKGDYKIQVDMQGTGYLYNLAKDPYEVNNLWECPGHISAKAEMLTVLAAEIMRVEGTIPAPHRRYRVKRHPKGFWRQKYASQDTGVVTQ